MAVTKANAWDSPDIRDALENPAPAKRRWLSPVIQNNLTDAHPPGYIAPDLRKELEEKNS
jgi:hypothetical protein